jgi:hypothetical protein
LHESGLTKRRRLGTPCRTAVQNQGALDRSSCPSTLLRFNQTVKEHLTMKNRNSIHWLAPVTVVALVLASPTIASQGPFPMFTITSCILRPLGPSPTTRWPAKLSTLPAAML